MGSLRLVILCTFVLPFHPKAILLFFVLSHSYTKHFLLLAKDFASGESPHPLFEYNDKCLFAIYLKKQGLAMAFLRIKIIILKI